MEIWTINFNHILENKSKYLRIRNCTLKNKCKYVKDFKGGME